MKLNTEELQEPINVTLGRLRASIKHGNSSLKERQLQLLEKISNDVERLGIKYPEDVLF